MPCSIRAVQIHEVVLIIAFTQVIGRGAVIAAAQAGTTQPPAREGGGLAACATPAASVGALPEIAEIIATVVASPDTSPLDACTMSEKRHTCILVLLASL